MQLDDSTGQRGQLTFSFLGAKVTLCMHIRFYLGLVLILIAWKQQKRIYHTLSIKSTFRKLKFIN